MNIFEALAVNDSFTEALTIPLSIVRRELRDIPVPPMPPQGVRFGCQGCHCHDFEAGIHWCYDRQARKFRNVAFIKACPLRHGG